MTEYSEFSFTELKEVIDYLKSFPYSDRSLKKFQEQTIPQVIILIEVLIEMKRIKKSSIKYESIVDYVYNKLDMAMYLPSISTDEILEDIEKGMLEIDERINYLRKQWKF